LLKFINICPIGILDWDIIEHIQGFIARRCGIDCRIGDPVARPEFAYVSSRDQFDSKAVLIHLLETQGCSALKILGITQVDLFVPILKYVYGLAQIEGRCSIISLYRLFPEYYDEPHDRDLFLSRIEKTALHEIGHTVGITHCRDRNCVMYSSVKIEDTDHKRPEFCQTCKELFRWYLAKS